MNIENNIIQKINKEFVNRLYDPKETGLEIVSQCIDEKNLYIINEFIDRNQSSFQEKREKYIENNQLVALLYRGKFDLNELSNTIFKEILLSYQQIRNQVEKYSDKPFKQGSSIEIKLIHYPISKLGVDIHKDLSSNLNIVVFFNLKGATDVKTYINKQGDGVTSHFIKEGDISIMRAPRLNEEEDLRPYHAVKEVNEIRTVLVIREIDEELEKITNKDNWRGF